MSAILTVRIRDMRLWHDDRILGMKMSWRIMQFV